MNSIFTRRSVRNFSGKTVEPDKVEKIMRAAMQTPSATNGQPWDFLVIRGKENLTKLSAFSAYASCLKDADVGIVVLGNRKRMVKDYYWEQELGACTQNIMLEATELGLGTVWFGTAPKEEKMNFIREMFGLEQHLLPFSVIAVGYPEKEDANKFVDRYDASRVRYID